jgi:hypothetical protein
MHKYYEKKPFDRYLFLHMCWFKAFLRKTTKLQPGKFQAVYTTKVLEGLKKGYLPYIGFGTNTICSSKGLDLFCNLNIPYQL